MKILIPTIILLVSSLGCTADKGFKESMQNPYLSSSKTLSVSENWQHQDSIFSLPAGENGTLSFDAWWTGNARPAADESVVLEFDFLDELPEPIRIEVLSGLGSENTWSELHRAGGQNTGEWRTARVPCPASMAWLSLPDSTLQFKIINGQANLSIKNVRLAPPEENDRAQWEKETRDWVEKSQDWGLLGEKYYALAQTPVIDKHWGKSAIVPFHRNWMNPVEQLSAPQDGETEFPATTRMAGNETEPFQMGIFANGKNLEQVAVSIEAVRDNSPAAKILIAEYSLIKSPVEGVEAETFPYMLWDNHAFDIDMDRSRLVRITFDSRDEKILPGSYDYTVSISSRNSDKIKIPLKVEVLPVRLPDLEDTGLLLGGHIRGFVPEQDLAAQSDYHHNFAGIYILPDISFENDELKLDFRVLDDWMAAASRQGFKSVYLFLGGNPFGFPGTMSLESKLAAAVFGSSDDSFREMAMAVPDSVHPDIAPYYREFASRIWNRALEKNWPRLVLSPMDEPNKWASKRDDLGSLEFIKSHFIHCRDLIKEANPDIPVAADMYTYDNAIVFLPCLDIYSTNSTHLHESLPDEIYAAGKEFWEYSTIDIRPSFNRYVAGFYFGSHRSTGTHLWAYNWGKRFDTFDGPNWQYAWYTPFGIVPTLCLEGLREGIDDRRWVEALKTISAEANDKSIDDLLENIYREVNSNREELRDFVIWTWPHANSGKTFSAEDLDRYYSKSMKINDWRNSIIDKVQLSPR